MNITAKPFFQKGNHSTHNSGINQPQNQQPAAVQTLGESPGILNEKNLYLFNKQQDEQFDRQQHWSKIFLTAPKI